MSGRTFSAGAISQDSYGEHRAVAFSHAARVLFLKLKPGDQNCPLCRAANGISLFENGVNVNTILGASGNFLIVPALGPLVVGHVLVISATHTEGLRFLPAKMQRRYELLSGELRAYCARLGDTVLEAEHGARNGSVRGPCIRHTHIHIMPSLGDAASIFDDRGDLEVVRSSASSPLGPYLWISNGSREKVYDASRAIGQEVRRTVGEHVGVDDWDWAVNPKTELIARTKEYWSGLDKWLG